MFIQKKFLTMETPTFSFFKAPIKSTRPYKEQIPLSDVYMVLTGHWYKERTATLRSITNPDENKEYKANNFPFVTFSGSFRYRKEKGLIKHSGLMVFDFDKLTDVEGLKMQLLTDRYFETDLLFTSPNGNGLKWVVSIDVTRFTHGQWFDAVSNYIKTNYQVEVDKSGRDVCRVCFLCYVMMLSSPETRQNGPAFPRGDLHHPPRKVQPGAMAAGTGQNKNRCTGANE
jgi:hypothetical protein